MPNNAVLINIYKRIIVYKTAHYDETKTQPEIKNFRIFESCASPYDQPCADNKQKNKK